MWVQLSEIQSTTIVLFFAISDELVGKLNSFLGSGDSTHSAELSVVDI